jgi:hypothetical protein
MITFLERSSRKVDRGGGIGSSASKRVTFGTKCRDRYDAATPNQSMIFSEWEVRHLQAAE